jgi:hypothetical protein
VALVGGGLGVGDCPTLAVMRPHLPTRFPAALGGGPRSFLATDAEMTHDFAAPGFEVGPFRDTTQENLAATDRIAPWNRDGATACSRQGMCWSVIVYGNSGIIPAVRLQDGLARMVAITSTNTGKTINQIGV